MDTIARTAAHNYYLRSLHHPLSYPMLGQQPTVAHSAPAPPPAQVAVCPYVLPKPHLPAPPTPKGTAAGDYYEALDARDQEIRKGACRDVYLSVRISLVCL